MIIKFIATFFFFFFCNVNQINVFFFIDLIWILFYSELFYMCAYIKKTQTLGDRFIAAQKIGLSSC